MSKVEQLVAITQEQIGLALANLHTVTIAKVVEVGETLLSVKPVIARQVNGESKPLPTFTKVKPVFLFGGGSSETWPIAVGDECLLITLERCFDLWDIGQDDSIPNDPRMHDYSDSVALFGIKRQADEFNIPEIITRVGDSIHTGNHEHVGDLTQTGNTTQEGDFNLTGDMSVTGNTESGTYSVGGEAGWTGNFATGDGRTLVVRNGIVLPPISNN